jgi:hypothetical protein
MAENVIYNIFSIRTYNNIDLVFYNYTKRKRVGDILSSYKTRYKRYLNKKDNWISVFHILKEEKVYIKIEEQIIISNDEMVKSRLCEICANNMCINKMTNEDIEKLCNKPNIIEEGSITAEDPDKIIEPETHIEPNNIIEQDKIIEDENHNEPDKIIESCKTEELQTTKYLKNLFKEAYNEINIPKPCNKSFKNRFYKDKKRIQMKTLKRH